MKKAVQPVVNLKLLVVNQRKVVKEKLLEEMLRGYKEEFDTIFESLARRAKKLVAGLNELEGVTCNASSGATHHKLTGGAAHLIGTGRGRVAQETQNTRPVWRWVREGREGDGEAAAYQEI